MFEAALLDLPECRTALDAMLLSAQTRGVEPMAIAIVNEHGEIMAFARMDGAAPAIRDFAIKKAYTAALMRADLKDFRSGLDQRGRTVADYSDPNLVGMAAGGVVIRDPSSGQVTGAIGVSGGTPAQDDEIAREGLQVLLASGK
jgi:uncharacterized protein GlcG (DUF336 family)